MGDGPWLLALPPGLAPQADGLWPGAPGVAPRASTASMSRAEGAQHDRRVERRHDRLPSLVLGAAVQPAPLAGLLQRVTGEPPVANRFASVERHPGQAVGDSIAHVLEVRSPAAH